MNQAELTGMVSLLLLVIILLSFAFIYIYIQYKKTTKDILYFANCAEEIAAGKYEDIVMEEETREMAHLTKAFNKMTKRLRIERERVEGRKEELRSILSSMNNGVIAIESGGRILFYNQSFLKLFHCDEKETEDSLLNESFYEYFHHDEIEQTIGYVEEEEEPVRREILLEYEGESSILLMKATPLYKKSKRRFGTLLIMEDVSRMKKLETIRKDFVSNVTHELKTPLTSIRGFVDTLKGGAIDDPAFARRFLDIIDIEAERLSILVNDILLLSEIESGSEKEKSMVNVEEVIDGVVALLRDKKKEDVEILKDMDGPVTDYLCNRHRLKELILNLADNGLKYTNKGRVTIKCWEEEKDLMLQFIDTGVGIPEEHLPRVFERFYRVDKGRSRKQGGTGLGLSIVKHIVELYKGDIRVVSETGIGTTFTVRLPYYE